MAQGKPNNEKRGRDRKSGNESEFDQRVLELKRVTRVVSGGKRMRFRALVIIGDRKGKVGYGLAKGNDVSQAVAKAIRQGEKRIVRLQLSSRGTITHPLSVKFSSARILMKPAPEGAGIIAGGAMRPVFELAGVRNVIAKMIGSRNKLNNVRATFIALKKMSVKTV